MPAERAPGDKSPGTVAICHVLQAEGRGESELARIQRGIVHRRQLSACGVSRGTIDHRVRTRFLHRIFPAVYALGHDALAERALEIAALLYAGDDSVISHATSAALWGFAPPRPELLHVTIVRRHVRHQPGLAIHRVAGLHDRDVRLLHGIPLTAPARTLIDHAATAGGAELERALAEARVLKLVTDRALQAAMDRAPLRAGVGALRALLRDEAASAITRSEAERILRKLVADAGLPAPRSNWPLHGYEVDMLWPTERVVVEIDGYAAHGHRRAFERDRRRDQVLQAAGYHVIRVTWRQLRDEPLWVAVRIGQTLARAAATA